MRWLLVFLPLAVAMQVLAPGQQLPIFFASALAIVPLVGWIARSTEHLASRSSDQVEDCSTPPSATPPD